MSFTRGKRNQKSQLKKIEFLTNLQPESKLEGPITHCLDPYSNCFKMSSVHPQPLEPSSILKISEDGDHVTKARSSSASCDCCHKRYLRCNFRVWQFLLLLFAILVIVSKMAVLAAIFGPGKATLEEDYTGIRN